MSSSSSSSSSMPRRRLLALLWLVEFAFVVAARLPAQELESLSVVAMRLGQKNWSFDGDDVDPCNDQPPWFIEDEKNSLKCNCSPSSQNTTAAATTTCHVTHIYLKSLNLNGSLPPELVGLPFLQVIDLTRNYLNGTIPPQWASMQSLTIIAVQGNRLTGPLPKEIANISTLEELVLEANEFYGTIPWEFGNLTRLRRLLLNSNNLSGELPASLAKLTSLTQFLISDNNFTGSIPNFIVNWTNIQRLEIQGSGLSGPIPSNLTSLTKLNDLRISDLNGGKSDFPVLNTSTSWDQVILRSCNIEGELPPYIGNLRTNESLDLSFNKLTGTIPPYIRDQRGDIYLTGNSLNGVVPNTIKVNSDLSYNNFNTVSPDSTCAKNSPNLFANSKGNTPGTFYCVKSTCEPNDFYKFHINCGSDKKVGEYEQDGPQTDKFYQSPSNWGFSHMGKFWDAQTDDSLTEYFFESSNSLSSISRLDSRLYSDARLSPLSLTYFGFCLRNGNYIVNLHFAEIIFTNDASFGSLGKRIFDIHIQGILVKKDYNIVNAAGGVNKAWMQAFNATVTDHTLEIRFYWAGKGTTDLPRRSVYGPLISAISVVHKDYRPANGTGAIVGIVMAVLFAVVVVLGFLWWKGCLGRKHSMHHDLKGLDLHTGSFTLRQIRAATNNFNRANKIGEGGFGPVHRGVLLDGTLIAVKQLSSKSNQGNREFVNEIGMISALQHPHLVKLYGCCIEGNQLFLVYEYMENNSLARALFGPEVYQLHMDWPTRNKICIGIARGLAYLHEESRLKIVHRDIKATNVLLDENLVPKISDFGLAKLDEEDNTHISTRIAGTFGYMAPEYAMRGYLTDKADVYSFGVVLLEIVSGKSNSSIRPKEERFYLLDWANSLKATGNLLELVDPRLELKVHKEEIARAINVALACTNVIAAERPSMSAVVSILEGKDHVPKVVADSTISIVNTKPNEIELGAAYGEGQSNYTEVPWSGHSTSDGDLYPITPDTNYWDVRGL